MIHNLYKLKWSPNIKCNFFFKYLQMEDAIASNTLIEYAAKCNDNISDVIALICETVSPGVLINLESLLILEVQGLIHYVLSNFIN